MNARAIQLSGPINAEVVVPGSKSITNRALVMAALASGESVLHGALDSDDTRAMAAGLAALGARIETTGDVWSVSGIDPARRQAERRVDAVGSGTTARFLMAVAGLLEGVTVIDGIERMRRRPVGELALCLTEMGAGIDWPGSPGYPPVSVRGGRLAGGDLTIDGSQSSQFVSGLLMIGPYCERDLSLQVQGRAVSRSYIDQTIEVMRDFGAEVGWQGEDTLVVTAGRGYRSREYRIEGDASAAVYPMAAAAVAGGTVSVGPIPEASLQADVAFGDVLRGMGCEVVHEGEAIQVTGSGRLAGVDLNMNHAPDAAVMVAVLGLFTSSPTRIYDVANLRIKESDRIGDLTAELRKLGADASAEATGMTVGRNRIWGAPVNPHGDHRLAMALAVAGLRLPDLSIETPDVVTKTWPSFYDALAKWRRPLVVAVDGPGGVGKSTVSRALAETLRLDHLETGAMYRAATLLALRNGLEEASGPELAAVLERADIRVGHDAVTVEGEDETKALRSEEVTAHVSRVSAHPEVRQLLVEMQRRWLPDRGGVVEGRDIGTVVFPQAPVKIFLTATVAVRASRRMKDLGLDASELARIEADLSERDSKDSSRTTSPLRPAKDAQVIDTSELSIEEVLEAALRTVVNRGPD
jgi:3-phosphoshikimate 1-carboxyvinyltransferase